MAFVKRLDELLGVAKERGVVDDATAKRLLALAGDTEKGRGVLNLAAVLSWLGGAVAVIGMILLVSANWRDIPDGVKIAGLLLLIAGSHGLAFWIRWSGASFEKSADALHFVGAGLFIAGVGLIAQIYHLDERPPNGVLVWIVAIAPLAVLLRSPSVTVLSVFAIVLWGHMEGSFAGSPLRMPDNFTSHLMLEIGVGAALIGTSAVLRDVEPGIARVFRGGGTFLLFGSLYLLCFFRHFSDVEEGSAVLPVAALVLGGAGVAAGARRLAPESRWMRNRLVLLLALALALGAVALGADLDVVPRGPQLEFFNFGHTRTFDLIEWGLSAAAWVLWFVLALWCVGFGARSGRKAYLNTGVLGVGLMVVTLFFDLIGTLATTGGIFLFGGLVLLGTGWGVERWRRSILSRMEAAS